MNGNYRLVLLFCTFLLGGWGLGVAVSMTNEYRFVSFSYVCTSLLGDWSRRVVVSMKTDIRIL